MDKYRRKSVVVEAVQFDPKQLPWPSMIKPQSTTLPTHLNHIGWVEVPRAMGVGRLAISAGQWVIMEGGEPFDVVDDAEFKQLYEPVG